jgi:hypothetical protein
MIDCAFIYNSIKIFTKSAQSESAKFKINITFYFANFDHKIISILYAFIIIFMSLKDFSIGNKLGTFFTYPRLGSLLDCF